jgi:hypothetical protein
MELILPATAFLATPWLGGLVGFVFAASVLAVLITLTFLAGLYYSVPKMILKTMGQVALSRA